MKTIKLDNGDEIELTGLSLDSRSIGHGDVFCACAGSITPAQENIKETGVRSHGIAYAGKAVNQGATAILWEPTEEVQFMPRLCHSSDKSREVFLFKVENLSKRIGQLAVNFYDDPSQDMQIIGVTGTNGKTSVTNYIAQSLSDITIYEKMDKKICGVIGTLGNGIYNDLSQSTHTTPDAISIQGLLRGMKKQHAESVAIEVSSHAIEQNRVADVKFDIAVFMNLTRDHLDYHGTMENYANSKKKLFLMPSIKTAIVNLDDQLANGISQSIDHEKIKLIGFSSNDSAEKLDNISADIVITAEKINFHSKGSQFYLCINDNDKINKTVVTLPLMGRFNISNALATASVLYDVGYKLKEIANLLEKLKSVSGRMQLIKNTNSKYQGIQIIVDYAHTPDALEKALKAIKNHSSNNIFCIFGCGGNRDKGKRAEMAKVSTEYADQIIITSDNPRDEDPLSIINDIEQGMGNNKDYKTEEDRKQAIELAIEQAKPGDIILVAGKGHEDYQEIKGVRHHYSDIKTCQELLAT